MFAFTSPLGDGANKKTPQSLAGPVFERICFINYSAMVHAPQLVKSHLGLDQFITSICNCMRSTFNFFCIAKMHLFFRCFQIFDEIFFFEIELKNIYSLYRTFPISILPVCLSIIRLAIFSDWFGFPKFWKILSFIKDGICLFPHGLWY